MLCDNSNARPACRGENDNSNSSGREVLLIPKPSVGGDKHVEPLLFGRTQQLAVLQGSPAKLIRSGNAVTRKSLPQRDGGSLVKQDPHLCGQQSRLGGVFQDVTGLRQGNAGKPLDELVNRGIFFEILEQRGNRNPRAPKNPGTTYAIRVALNIGAGRPINHVQMVALWAREAKAGARHSVGDAPRNHW